MYPAALLYPPLEGGVTKNSRRTHQIFEKKLDADKWHVVQTKEITRVSCVQFIQCVRHNERMDGSLLVAAAALKEKWKKQEEQQRCSNKR